MATPVLSMALLAAGWVCMMCQPIRKHPPSFFPKMTFMALRFPTGKRKPDLPPLALRLVPSHCSPHCHRPRFQETQALTLSPEALPSFLCCAVLCGCGWLTNTAVLAIQHRVPNSSTYVSQRGQLACVTTRRKSSVAASSRSVLIYDHENCGLTAKIVLECHAREPSETPTRRKISHLFAGPRVVCNHARDLMACWISLRFRMRSSLVGRPAGY